MTKRRGSVSGQLRGFILVAFVLAASTGSGAATAAPPRRAKDKPAASAQRTPSSQSQEGSSTPSSVNSSPDPGHGIPPAAGPAEVAGSRAGSTATYPDRGADPAPVPARTVRQADVEAAQAQGIQAPSRWRFDAPGLWLLLIAMGLNVLVSGTLLARLWKPRRSRVETANTGYGRQDVERRRGGEEAKRLKEEIRTIVGDVTRPQFNDLEKRLTRKIEDISPRTVPSRIEVTRDSPPPRAQLPVRADTPPERLRKILGEYKKGGSRDARALREACDEAGARWGTAFLDGDDADSRFPVTWEKTNGYMLVLQLDRDGDEVLLLPNGNVDRGVLTAVAFSSAEGGGAGPVGAVEEARGILEPNSRGETVIRITKRGQVI